MVLAIAGSINASSAAVATSNSKPSTVKPCVTAQQSVLQFRVGTAVEVLGPWGENGEDIWVDAEVQNTRPASLVHDMPELFGSVLSGLGGWGCHPSICVDLRYSVSDSIVQCSGKCMMHRTMGKSPPRR